MLRLDERVKILISVILGVVLFSIDIVFGFFTTITLNLGGFVLILFLTGIPAGSFRNGLVSAAVSLLLMIPIGMVLLPFVVVVQPTDIVGGIIAVMLTLMCRPLGEAESEGVGGLCLAVILLPFVIFIAPLYFFFGIVIAGLGGKIGSSLWERIEPDSNESEPSSGLEIQE